MLLYVTVNTYVTTVVDRDVIQHEVINARMAGVQNGPCHVGDNGILSGNNVQSCMFLLTARCRH